MTFPFVFACIKCRLKEEARLMLSCFSKYDAVFLKSIVFFPLLCTRSTRVYMFPFICFFTVGTNELQCDLRLYIQGEGAGFSQVR